MPDGRDQVHPNWIRALREWAKGREPSDISDEFGVPARDLQEYEAASLKLYIGDFGYSAALAPVRIRSELLRPRDPATTEMFNGLVRRAFVPPLKDAGYRKTGLTWLRQGGEVWPAVNIQRANADGDLLRFTSNWSLKVPGFYDRMFPGYGPERRIDGAVEGRIGDFLDGQQDTWWSVQIGWLSRDFPRVLDDPAVVEAEIVTGLADMLAFLDANNTIEAVIHLIEADPNTWEPTRKVTILRDLQSAAGNDRS